MTSYERTTTTSRHIQVTSAYRFPNRLQVDRSSRRRLARCYYDEKVFVFANEAVAVRFISVLDGTFLGLIDGIRFIEEPQHKAIFTATPSLVSGFQRKAREHGFDYSYCACPTQTLANKGEPFMPLSFNHMIIVLQKKT